MRMYYGNTPIKSAKVKHYEISTNDATIKASDLQTGITAYGKGKKITGTGKSFEFARYGSLFTNFPTYIPSLVNIIEIASIESPLRISISLNNMKDTDFSISQTIGYIFINNIEYPITALVSNDMLTISCEQSISLQVFYGKDNYT